MRPELPEAFEKRMREMLGDEEFGEYLESFHRERQYGLRINPRKITGEELAAGTSFHLSPIPWTNLGYFYEAQDQPGRHPYYAAGVYYLQEPSAMTPASRLEIKPGDRVLDLCAAPGGKSTALGAALGGEGVLVANDISNSRAKALLKNLELFGIPNLLVTNEVPGNLAERFEGYFNKVLIDAPCSGEGMFRKDPAVIKTWSEERPEYFARLQKDILKNGIRMLAPGGLLLYSTCTFAPVENEGSISWVLEQFPEMEVLSIKPYEGFVPGRPEWGNGDPRLSDCVRIWPHKMRGEGHFLALLRKADTDEVREMDSEIPDKKNGKKQKKAGKRAAGGGTYSPTKEERRILEEFFGDCSHAPVWERVEIRGGKVYQVPQLPQHLEGLHFLRNGLYLGELKKGRFEPSQQLAMTLGARDYAGVLRLSPEDERVEKYLRGETISVKKEEVDREKGWILICVDNFSLGWGKKISDQIKNKYWCGWRKS